MPDFRFDFGANMASGIWNVVVIPRYDLHPDWIEIEIKRDGCGLVFAPGTQFVMVGYGLLEVIEDVTDRGGAFLCKRVQG